MPHTLLTAISADRFGTYLKEAGFDQKRALDLYMWNMNLSSSFFPLMASVEVALRNRVLLRIEHIHGPSWWTEAPFMAQLGGKGKGIVKRTEVALLSRNLLPNSGQMAASLTFGFWANMLLPKYEAVFWTPLHPSFPDLPHEFGRADLYLQCEAMRALRNRISHHEPLINTNISKTYSDSIRLLSWISKAKADWLKPHLRVMAVLRSKP